MSVTPAAAAARIASTGWPLETARSVTESTLRPALTAAAAIRSRSAARRSGKFCEDLNIWTPKPLRYTASGPSDPVASASTPGKPNGRRHRAIAGVRRQEQSIGPAFVLRRAAHDPRRRRHEADQHAAA